MGTIRVVWTVFLKLPATADHHMGGRRRRDPLSYCNFPLGCKIHAILLLLRIDEELKVKLALNRFLAIN